MDTAISPSSATATHNQMRDETRGLEPVIMMSSLIQTKRVKLRIEIARRVYTNGRTRP
jgi:hypothetical protein